MVEEPIYSSYKVKMANILSLRRAYEEEVHREGVLQGLRTIV